MCQVLYNGVRTDSYFIRGVVFIWAVLMFLLSKSFFPDFVKFVKFVNLYTKDKESFNHNL